MYTFGLSQAPNVMTIDLAWDVPAIRAQLDLWERRMAAWATCPHRDTWQLAQGRYCWDCQQMIGV